MSVDKDSNGTDEQPPVERPPAVSERLWNLIEPDSRKRYVKAAALGLRRGIHPETTVTEMLQADNGWDAVEISAAAQPSSAHPDEQSHYDDHFYDDPSEFRKASPQKAVEQAGQKGQEAHGPRAPVWGFGTDGYRRPSMPVGEIGGILHYESGFDGPAAAEMEWLVHRAIARDPSFVLRDVGNLQLLGCSLPADVAVSIRNAVLFECRCVIEDIRRRRADGDLAAMMWIDPEELVL
jgi:hypothetical protein